MAVHYRAQIIWKYDSAEPVDYLTINPCFRDSGATSDPQGLADDLVAGAAALSPNPTSQPMQVRLYDVEGTKPVFPAAIAESHWTNSPPDSDVPRELACCLSFYHEHNVPSFRGRLYLPQCVLNNTPANCQREVTSSTLAKLAPWANLFANLGGADVDWIIWSVKNQVAHNVTHWWGDSEWDTVRSRGLKSKVRVGGTVDED